MMPRTSLWAIALSLTSFVLHVDSSCMHGTSLMRRQVTPEGKVKVSNFGYTDLQGPLNWASLAPENIACSTGTTQSPINLGKPT